MESEGRAVNALTSWISVADEQPDDGQTVLIYCPDADEPVWMGYFDSEVDAWRDVDATRCRPSHWAPLPERPGAAFAPNLETHWRCGCVQRDEDGSITSYKLLPRTVLRCDICGGLRDEDETTGGKDEGRAA